MPPSITRSIMVLAALVAASFISGCHGAGDVEEERVALLQADREFAAMSVEEGFIEAYYRNMADDAILLPPGGDLRVGRERIYREDTERGLSGLLQWEPQAADVARSGDLGWTWGRWVFTVESEPGDSERTYGKYVFVWKKTGGRWKVVANIWNDSPAPSAD